jgi:hypothetical protein
MVRICAALLACAALAVPAATAEDVVGPAEVEGVRVERAGDDLRLTWSEVTTDAAGQPETVDFYRVYRGTSPDFVPDKDGGSNRIGEPALPEFTDPGAALGNDRYYYRVTAVDTATNESASKPSAVTTPPVLSGSWTETGIDLSWTDAEPLEEVTGYRVYCGRASGDYERMDDVGLVNSHTVEGLEENVVWYCAVTAVDTAGNESDFSNEHQDVVGGTLDIRAHDDDELCWGADKCTPADPDKIQRADGFQLLVPVDFPEGEWTSITMTFTMDSKLCKRDDPHYCDGPPWNPCGDPWDRTAHAFVVLDDCVETGGSCITHDNLELMRSITPFGTDAPEPEGSGEVPPRSLEIDITPFAPLLVGQQRYIGTHIGHYTPKGWWVTVDFHLSKRPEDASPEPPADGIEPLFFGGAAPPTDTVSIPPEATQVYTRLFTTGHGGSAYCDGGSNDGEPCEGSADCPGGECGNCDEFCTRTNRILVDGAPVWEYTPWRDCCYPRDSFECVTFGFGGPGCQEWNSCGFPSCSYARAGWCPGEIACHYNLDEGCDQDLDMTEHLPAGGTYDMDYEVLVNRGSWSVSLALYWYE